MKQKIIFALFALLLVFAQATNAQTEILFKEYDLPNGLHVIVHEDHTTPIVAVSVMYHVGSKNEKPERTGFAHFFEHLLFEGSDNIGRGEYAKYVEKNGGTLNANTTQDRTYYYEILPSNQLELGLWLESERMLHAKVENKGIETQRQVVKEERRLRYDNRPYGTFLEQTVKRAFKKHPYNWSVIGSMEHLDAAKEEDYVGFYKQFYVPNNAILSIAGDISVAQVKELVQRYFEPIPRGKGEVYRPKIVEPALEKEIRDTVYDNIQLPGVYQSYRIPAQGTEDFYALELLGQLLSRGESSRMNKAIVDEQQKAVRASSFPLSLEDPGLSVCFAIAAVGVDAGDLEKAMDKEIQKVQKELITDNELQKLRNQIENDFVNSNATIAGRAESLANYKMYFGDTGLINSEIKRYMKVTKEDIQRVAKQYFVPNNRVVLYYLPKSAKKPKT